MSKEKSKQTLSDRYSEMTGNNSNNPLQNLGSRHKPLIIGGIAVVVAAGIAIATVSLSGHSDKKSDNDSSAYNLVVTPEGNDASSDETVSKAAAGTYDVCMNSNWVFSDARSASANAYVENITTNTNTVNFIVKRDDTGDTIYESPYIPVGSSLEKIKLNDESLSKGTYPCTLTYHLVDEQHIDISTLNISISVVIECCGQAFL